MCNFTLVQISVLQKFIVQMPKKSITFECNNPDIYPYVCVMRGELMMVAKGCTRRREMQSEM